MSLLDKLEQLMQQEHAALIKADWRALQSCVDEKLIITDQLSAEDLRSASVEQTQRIYEKTRYNADLAAKLSRTLSDLVGYSHREPTYNRGGRLGHRPPALMSLRG